MDVLSLSALLGANVLVVVLSGLYLQRLKLMALNERNERRKKEVELKRHALELEVLRSLEEHLGHSFYFASDGSFDLRDILEVLIKNLPGFLETSAVSYMMLVAEEKVIFRVQVEGAISHSFLDQVKGLMLSSFSKFRGQNVLSSDVEEKVGGLPLSQSETKVGSYFNLPLTLGGQVVALINIASVKPHLYPEEEQALLYSLLNSISYQVGRLSEVIESEKQRISSLISSLSDGVMMVTPNFTLAVANPALSAILNIPRAVTLEGVAEALGGAVDLMTVLSKGLREMIPVKIREFAVGEKVLQLEVEPVKDKFGYILGVVVVFYDLTWQKQAERVRGDFTAMMVHELRTPLTTISYNTDMMLSNLSQLSSLEIEQNLRSIRSTTTETLSLIDDLLDVAKIEAGKFEVIKKRDDLRPLIEERVNIFQPLAEGKHLKLYSEFGDTLPDVAYDRRRIGQVLDNLLSNALKYTSAGEIVIGAKFTTVPGGPKLLVSVRDSGEGIRQEDIFKLFSKFKQFGKGKTGERSGTGLGLVIARGIVEAHGGKIWAASKGEGQGTTFTFSLPLS